jgi:hypothetical protein
MLTAPTEVDYEIVIEAVVKQCGVSRSGYVDAKTAMEVGFARVQAACEVFFDEATRAQQNSLAASRGLDALLIGATAAFNPTMSAAAAARAVTITAAGVTLAKSIIEGSTSIYTFSKNLYKVREHVTTSMDTYIVNARANPPDNYCLAYAYVQKFATLCSLAAMQSFHDLQMAFPTVAGGVIPPAKGDAEGNGRSGRSAGGGYSASSGPPLTSFRLYQAR